MTTLEIKHLFKHNRFPENELKILCLVLYLPVGLVLVILRTILALSIILLGYVSDSPVIHKIVNKIACLSLGLSVTVENPEKKEDVEVYVSNSLSVFDHLAVHTCTGTVTPGKEMLPSLSKGLGVHDFGNQSNVETLKKKMTKLITEEKIPIHFAPEDKVTNGKALLKFKTFPFSLSNKVQPICVTIRRPFLDISVTVLGATYWTDVFFYMFSPLTNYRIKFLSPLEKKSLEVAEFSEIVRQNVASGLEIEASELSAADLLEWEKRKLAEQQRRPAASRPSSDSELRRMASQVKEVLPHVPLNAILKDLIKSRNVDTTITNILEGRVLFVPEQIGGTSSASLSEPSTSSSKTSSSSAGFSSPPLGGNNTMFNTAASSFAKSAQDRNKSFQERKDQLIANARRRYIEKHNLDIPF